jgi:hypothetical protein
MLALCLYCSDCAEIVQTPAFLNPRDWLCLFQSADFQMSASDIGLNHKILLAILNALTPAHMCKLQLDSFEILRALGTVTGYQQTNPLQYCIQYIAIQ